MLSNQYFEGKQNKVTAPRVTWADILDGFEQESFSEEMVIRKGLSEVRKAVKKYLVDHMSSYKDYI